MTRRPATVAWTVAGLFIRCPVNQYFDDLVVAVRHAIVEIEHRTGHSPKYVVIGLSWCKLLREKGCEPQLRMHPVLDVPMMYWGELTGCSLWSYQEPPRIPTCDDCGDKHTHPLMLQQFCPSCQGRGCTVCGGRGIRLVPLT